MCEKSAWDIGSGVFGPFRGRLWSSPSGMTRSSKQTGPVSVKWKWALAAWCVCPGACSESQTCFVWRCRIKVRKLHVYGCVPSEVSCE